MYCGAPCSDVDVDDNVNFQGHFSSHVEMSRSSKREIPPEHWRTDGRRASETSVGSPSIPEEAKDGEGENSSVPPHQLTTILRTIMVGRSGFPGWSSTGAWASSGGDHHMSMCARASVRDGVLEKENQGVVMVYHWRHPSAGTIPPAPSQTKFQSSNPLTRSLALSISHPAFFLPPPPPPPPPWSAFSPTSRTFSNRSYTTRALY